MQIITRLIDHWSGQGLCIRPGLDEEAILSFERQNGMHLPPEFRAYLQAANGMEMTPLNDADNEGFSFWPVEKMQPVPDELRSIGQRVPTIPGLESFWVFADYMQWSWAYAIGTGESQAGRILHIGVHEPRILVESFGAFVELYLADSPLIYPPAAGNQGTRSTK